MINLRTFMELIEYRITEGSDFHINLPNLYCLSYWDGNQDGASANIIFDPKDQTVYAVEVCDYKNSVAYRLKDSRVDLDDEAWDDVQFIELETDADFVAKAFAILHKQ